ncbi:MAG: hypothetical protein IPH44_28820 [Myxococcales bacterium]|nr:hypothetical protein [Myxococcales bacterium]
MTPLDHDVTEAARSLEDAAVALAACVEGIQPEDFRERARRVAVALGRLYVAALASAALVESAGPITQPHELPAVPRPAGFGLAPGDDAYRATRHAVYRDEYGRERDVEDHSVAADVLEIHGFVARYLQAIAAGTLGRADAMRSMRVSFFAVQPLIPRVLRALDELASW